LTAWPQPQRDRFLAALPDDKRSLFAIFGLRAATLSIRQLNPEWLRLGLMGYAIAHVGDQSGHNPGGGLDTALAVFYHCARMLENETEKLFDEAAGYASNEMAERIRAFGHREDVTLKKFGWREIRTPEGIRFKFEW
jgi:hypothetical protein